jgi:hypothetical protein
MMKKIRKVIPMGVAICFLISLTTPFANAVNISSLSPVERLQKMDPNFDMSTSEVIESKDENGETMYICKTGNPTSQYREISLADFGRSLGISYTLNGNKLTYTLPDGTEAKISERINAEGLREWAITENGRNDVLTFDSAAKKFYLNGKLAEVVSQEVTMISQMPVDNTTQSSSDWYYYSSGEVEIRTDDIVKNTSASVLYALMGAALNPLLGAGISIAITIINAAAAISSLSKAVYVMRDLYRDYNYMSWKAINTYYLDPDYSQYASSNVAYYYGS